MIGARRKVPVGRKNWKALRSYELDRRGPTRGPGRGARARAALHSESVE